MMMQKSNLAVLESRKNHHPIWLFRQKIVLFCEVCVSEIAEQQQ
tara:strand:+ start:748 stop:879 length:132 start_codon:yes stop_codon:yes gene_type:complete